MKFTGMEKLILDTLMKSPEEMVDIKVLQELKLPEIPRKGNFIAVHIKNIRLKLKSEKKALFDIETVRRKGYKIISKEE